MDQTQGDWERRKQLRRAMTERLRRYYNGLTLEAVDSEALSRRIETAVVRRTAFAGGLPSPSNHG